MDHNLATNLSGPLHLSGGERKKEGRKKDKIRPITRKIGLIS